MSDNTYCINNLMFTFMERSVEVFDFDTFYEYETIINVRDLSNMETKFRYGQFGTIDSNGECVCVAIGCDTELTCIIIPRIESRYEVLMDSIEKILAD